MIRPLIAYTHSLPAAVSTGAAQIYVSLVLPECYVIRDQT